MSILAVFAFFFFYGCNGATTTASTTSGLSTTVSGTDQTTTGPETTTIPTIVTDTSGIIPTTSGDIIEQDGDFDSLVISIDRLENADFEIDFDSIFAEASANPEAPTVLSRYIPNPLSGFRRLTSGNEYEIYDPDDYLQHPYWNQFYYHKSLYEAPIEEDGMYVFTTTLNSYNSQALNNLYDCAGRVTTTAKELADWAVENITVVDTWIRTDENREYLLHYDDANDVVALYTYWYIESQNMSSFDKVLVYYNDIGEEVIECWTTQLYVDNPSYPGVSEYHNSIAGRDFNYYVVWLDEEFQPKPDTHLFRGINMNQYGYYEYYENSSSMVSGEYGWYTIDNYISDDNRTIYYNGDQGITVLCPSGDSNVLQINSYGDSYVVQVFLPAMNGLEGLVVEKDAVVQRNQDSEATIQMLIELGIEPMPDQYVINDDAGTSWITGFQTAKGRFLSTDDSWDGSVKIQGVDVRIFHEGEREYQQYFKYFGFLRLRITADSRDQALEKLVGFLDYAGLAYKYGDTTGLFAELAQVCANIEEYTRKISITNPIIDNPYHLYSSFDDFENTTAFIIDYISASDEIIRMLDEYDEAWIYDIPQDVEASAAVLNNMNSVLDGEAVIDSELHQTISTSGLTFTLNPSPLLRGGQEYSIFYALSIGDKNYIIDSEDKQTYQQQTMVWNSDRSISLPAHVPAGEYVLTAFVARITESGNVRVSNVAPIAITDTEPFSFNVQDEASGGVWTYQWLVSDGHAYVRVLFTDTEAPAITSGFAEGEFSGEQTITEEIGVYSPGTVGDLLGLFTGIADNYDSFIDYGPESLSRDGIPFTAMTDPLHSGTYVFSVSDNAGNTTTITLTNVVLYHDVSFCDEFGTPLSSEIVREGEAATPPETVPDKIGYTFSGWNQDYQNIQGDLNLFPLYVPNAYDIIYMVDDVTYYTVQDVGYNSYIVGLVPDVNPVKEGYNFMGWTNMEVDFMPDSDLVRTAIFVEIIT